jgi:serine/threonine-protein kinase
MCVADDLYRKLVQERGDPPVLGGVLFSNLLGSGGMGLVFKGLHLRLSIPVAVKVMLSPAQGSQTPLLDEARASARVNHPNVVRVYDLGKEGDLFYMVQEFVEGRTAKNLLDDACAGRTLSEQSVLSLGCDVARGLAATHAAGYLHRDVKPENIIISSKDGMAKLFDLGIAVRWGLASPDGKGEDRGPSEIFGTPGYVSPEHLLGLPLGPASDIFGLGVTLYELLAGRLAFTDSSTAALLTETTRQDLPDVRAGHRLIVVGGVGFDPGAVRVAVTAGPRVRQQTRNL